MLDYIYPEEEQRFFTNWSNPAGDELVGGCGFD